MRYLLGPLGLTVGLLMSTSAMVWWAIAARQGSTGRAARQARVASHSALLGAAVAVVAMVNALVKNDFAVRYVAENGGRAVPMYYKVITRSSAFGPPSKARCCCGCSS